MWIYLCKVKSFTVEFEPIAISQNMRHDIRNVDALPYLAIMLEVESPHTLQIDIQETRSIKVLSPRICSM